MSRTLSGTPDKAPDRALSRQVPAVLLIITACGCTIDPGYGPQDNGGLRDTNVSTDRDDGGQLQKCELDYECEDLVNDATGCVVAMCDFGFCAVRKQAEGHPCDDGFAATVADTCDGYGRCAGRSAACGDGACDAEREDCHTCPDDCGCATDMICVQNECIPEPVDGDGVCDAIEDCGTSPQDCGCNSGYACVDAECMTCREACDQDLMECGELGGCTCGKCTGGLECSIIGRCEIPGLCGDGECLTAFETCDNCPGDCGCGSDSTCVDAACKKCSTVCRGIDCGMVDGCDCGQPEPCKYCEDGEIKTDCRCLCRANQMECGSIQGCSCGNNNGGCLNRMTCQTGLCMPDCKVVCEDLECGSIGNCLCARCAKSGTTTTGGATLHTVCYDKSCEDVTFDADEYEPNNFPADAYELGPFTDADGTPDWDTYGVLAEATDRDWYVFDVRDTWGETLFVNVVLDGMSEDSDLNLMVCFACENGMLIGTGLTSYDDVAEVGSTIEGARCFESRRTWGQRENVWLSPSCSGGFNDSGTVWIKVSPAEKADARTDYLIGFDL